MVLNEEEFNQLLKKYQKYQQKMEIAKKTNNSNGLDIYNKKIQHYEHLLQQGGNFNEWERKFRAENADKLRNLQTLADTNLTEITTQLKALIDNGTKLLKEISNYQEFAQDLLARVPETLPNIDQKQLVEDATNVNDRINREVGPGTTTTTST